MASRQRYQDFLKLKISHLFFRQLDIFTHSSPLTHLHSQGPPPPSGNTLTPFFFLFFNELLITFFLFLQYSITVAYLFIILKTSCAAFLQPFFFFPFGLGVPWAINIEVAVFLIFGSLQRYKNLILFNRENEKAFSPQRNGIELNLFVYTSLCVLTLRRLPVKESLKLTTFSSSL